jgi:hypothetical protein
MQAHKWLLTLIVVAVPSYAQLPYSHSISLSVGAYAASGLGTNPHYAARYNYFISGGKFFVEGALGFGSLRSNVLASITKSQLFESERLYTYEFVAGFDPFPNSYVPFMILGVAGINQGGQSMFAGVIGLGKRIPLRGVFGGNQFGLRYDVRDQIFSQRILNKEPFVSHNFAFTVGVQFYF